ncbi:hypothetical protein [Alcanivorax sp.]|uniref:hypothetical protein n=1 Tax=Alcanivorax sp. TaxID=1872427 RepID=UPI003A91A5EF
MNYKVNMCSHKAFKGAIVMTLFFRLFKDTLALMIAIAVTVLIVAGLRNNGENLFSVMLAFACMVPVIASAAVAIKRDWDNGGFAHAF